MVKLLAQEAGGYLGHKGMEDSFFSFSVIPFTQTKKNSSGQGKLRSFLLKKITKKLIHMQLNEENYKDYELGPIIAYQKLKKSSTYHKSENIKRKNNSITREVSN